MINPLARVVGLLFVYEWNSDERALALDDARIAARYCGDASVNRALADQIVQKAPRLKGPAGAMRRSSFAC